MLIDIVIILKNLKNLKGLHQDDSIALLLTSYIRVLRKIYGLKHILTFRLNASEQITIFEHLFYPDIHF